MCVSFCLSVLTHTSGSMYPMSKIQIFCTFTYDQGLFLLCQCCDKLCISNFVNNFVEKPSVLWRCWLGGRKGIQPVKNWGCGAGVVICLQRGADLHMAQLMPLPLTVFCFSKIQIGFIFLVPAYPGSPEKGPLNRCVCMCSSFVDYIMFAHNEWTVIGHVKERMLKLTYQWAAVNWGQSKSESESLICVSYA